MKFEEMPLSPALLTAVRASGYTTPTPIQEATIPLAAGGKDILGCAQTGTGKTAAFVLPILERLLRKQVAHTHSVRPIRALILTPTRELALQNDEVFRQMGVNTNLRSAVIFGGVNQNPQVQALKAGVDILVATPGRLNDLIGQGYISLTSLEIFVLDEADRMLDMGFIHDVKKIVALLPVRRQTLLFSATMPPAVEQLALHMLTSPATVKVDPVTSTVKKIRQSVYFVDKGNKKDLLVSLLCDHGVSTALVFTRTKSNADQVVRLLRRNGIESMAIHGNKSQNARQAALSSFKEGKIAVLCATDIAARGIDIIELPFVINYNIPEEPETYIHRIGRTGRAGLGGTAISLCCAEELEDWRAIVKLTGVSIPTATCEWSVTDMVPVKRVKQQQQPRGRDSGHGRDSHGRESGQKNDLRPEKKKEPVNDRNREPQQVNRNPSRQEKQNAERFPAPKPKQTPYRKPHGYFRENPETVARERAQESFRTLKDSVSQEKTDSGEAPKKPPTSRCKFL